MILLKNVYFFYFERMIVELFIIFQSFICRNSKSFFVIEFCLENINKRKNFCKWCGLFSYRIKSYKLAMSILFYLIKINNCNDACKKADENFLFFFFYGVKIKRDLDEKKLIGFIAFKAKRMVCCTWLL